MKYVILSIALSLATATAWANRQDFNKPSKEMVASMATAATGLGYDLSTAEGRQQFGDYLKTQKDTLATSLGIDATTEEGRKKLHDAVKTHVDEVAAAQGFDMKTKEGREALEKYLVTKGEYAYLRPMGPGKEDRKEDANRPKPKEGLAADAQQKPAARPMEKSVDRQTSSESRVRPAAEARPAPPEAAAAGSGPEQRH